MQTDRLLLPSKDIQRLVEQLWLVVRSSGDALVQRSKDDTEIRTRVAYLESELESLASLNDSQGATIEQWRTELEGIDELRSEYRALRAEHERVLQTLASKEEALTEMQSRLSDIEGQAAIAASQNDELQDLHNELNAVTVRAQNMEGVLQERSRELSALHLEVATLRAEAEQATIVAKQLQDADVKRSSHNDEQLIHLQSALHEQQRAMTEQQEVHQNEVVRLNAVIRDLQAEREVTDNSEAKYRSLVDEMNLAIAEREQQLRQYELKLQEYEEWKEELKKKSSKAPTLIEGMLRSDVESLSSRVAQLEEERTQWTEQATDSVDERQRKEDRKQQLHGIAEKLRTAVEILERSTSQSRSAS